MEIIVCTHALYRSSFKIAALLQTRFDHTD